MARQESAWLRQAQEIARLGNWDQNPRTGELWWSDQTYRLFNLDPQKERMTFQRFLQMVHPDDREMIVIRTEQALASDATPYRVEYRITCPGQDELFVHEEAIIERNAHGDPENIVGIIQDITERKATEKALLKSEQAYRSFFTEMLNGFALHEIICDDGGRPIDYRFLAVNAAFERLTGLRAEDLIGRPAREVLPGIENHWIDRYGKVALTGNPIHFEASAAGLDRHYSISAYRPGKNQFACIIEDISAAKRAEEALRTSEEKYRILFESAGDSIFIHDSNARLLAVNRLAYESLGYTESELMAKSIMEIDTPDQAVHAPSRIEKLMQSGSVSFETAHLRKDGSRLPLEVGSRKILWEGKEAMLSICRDITERKQAEAELTRISERLSLATRAAKQGIWDWDVARNELVWDALMYELYGVRREDFSGAYEAWLAGVHPEDRAASDTATRQALRGEREFDTEFRILRPDGAVRVIKSHGIVIRDEAGVAERMIGVDLDITEHKYLEAQLRQSQKMEAIGQLAGGVAHDFNNILNVILGYGELLRGRLAHDETELSYLHEIITAGRRAADLTAGLLSYSRKQLLNLQPLAVNAALEQFARLLRRVIGENIELRLDLAPVELTVKADRSHFEQVIMNLATNARDAMPGGGTLTIATFVSPNGPESAPAGATRSGGLCAGIRITDTGAGMAESVRTRVFDPFFTTKEVGKGTGLGLSICQGIVSQHGGGIQVRSTPGAGTTFEILLPLIEPPAGSAPSAGIVAPAPVDAPADLETILVVEDDPHVRKLTALQLSGAGHRVLEAGDGEEALHVFNEHASEIRLVVLDVIMPKRGGSEVLMLMRKTHPRLAAVFISGYSADLLDASVLEQPTVAFLRKPFNPQDLLAVVRRLLDRGTSTG